MTGGLECETLRGGSLSLSLEEWVEGYRRAWEEADAEGVTDLFTEDAQYRSFIYEEPNVGHEGVRAYWESVTASQSEVVVRMGTPFVDGDRVAVEFWTEMLSDGAPVTLAGCLLLEFADDGRCRRLREYWNITEGRHQPPTVWGT